MKTDVDLPTTPGTPRIPINQSAAGFSPVQTNNTREERGNVARAVEVNAQKEERGVAARVTVLRAQAR